MPDTMYNYYMLDTYQKYQCHLNVWHDLVISALNILFSDGMEIWPQKSEFTMVTNGLFYTLNKMQTHNHCLQVPIYKTITLSFRSQRNLNFCALLCMKTPSRWPVSTALISIAFEPHPIMLASPIRAANNMCNN